MTAEQTADTVDDDATWDAASSPWDASPTTAWAETVPWEAEATYTNGYGHDTVAEPQPTLESAEPFEAMVDETVDEPSATVSEWSAEEATGESVDAVAEAVATEPDDAPWESDSPR